MADLIDRISGEDGVKINLHRFVGVQRLYAFGAVSRAQVVAEFDLQGDEVTQAAALADKIDAETGAMTRRCTCYWSRACACASRTTRTHYSTTRGRWTRARYWPHCRLADGI